MQTSGMQTQARTLLISVLRTVGLVSKNPNLAPFVYFQFYTFDEILTLTSVGSEAVFDETHQFQINTDNKFSKFLENGHLELIVFDDNAPMQERQLLDVIGTCRVQLKNLLQDQAVEGFYPLFNSNGVSVGQIQVKIN